MEVLRVQFPWGMDANEYAQKVQPPAKALQGRLKAAEWVGGKVGGRPATPPATPIVSFRQACVKPARAEA